MESLRRRLAIAVIVLAVSIGLLLVVFLLA